MSLLNSESRPCATVIRASVDDGEGGQVTKYMQGRKFLAVVTPDNTVSAKKTLGNNEISAKTYKFFYPDIFTLQLNDVIKTLDDEKTYKVTALETAPARSASVQYALCSAEEWELPNE